MPQSLLVEIAGDGLSSATASVWLNFAVTPLILLFPRETVASVLKTLTGGQSNTSKEWFAMCLADSNERSS